MDVFRIKRGDRAPSLRAALTARADGSPANLAGASVQFRMRPVGAKSVTVQGAASVVDEAGGVVEYVWQDGDTEQAGAYEAEFRVTFADGRPQTFPTDDFVPVEVEPSLV